MEYKNRAWAVPKPTEQEEGDWQRLKGKLDELKLNRPNHVKIIVSTNSHSVKKSDKTHKRYKKDIAIKDERLLLSDVAFMVWEKFHFPLTFEFSPTFGDLRKESGFIHCSDVRGYFYTKSSGLVKKDDINEFLTAKEWIWLIGLDLRVNGLLHDKLITNQDGSFRLVLEHVIYEAGVGMAKNRVRKFYGPETMVHIIDASAFNP